MTALDVLYYHSSTEELFILIHFALSDPITHPMTSSLTSSEIPITQPPTLTSSWTLEG